MNKDLKTNNRALGRLAIRRRARTQSGNEIMEFALIAVFLMPMLIFVFVNGMNLVRLIQCAQITRDLGKLYIGGVDYTTYQAQLVAQRLANGYGLQIGSSYTGNNNSNSGNGGTGYVILSQIMYVGATACAGLPSGTTCTNQNQYVFLQRIKFGNASLQFSGTTVASSLGNPTGSTINSAGYTANYLTDSNTRASNVSTFFPTQLADGQAAYVVETFFASPDLAVSAFPGGGLHSINFF